MRLFENVTMNMFADGVQNKLTGAFVNDATVSYIILLASDSSTVVSSTAMAYVTDSDGDYKGVLLSSESITAGTEYLVKIIVDSTDDDERAEFVTAERRPMAT